MVFERNQGQTDSRVDFLARGKGYGLFFSAGAAATLVMMDADNDQRARALRMEFVGADRTRHGRGTDPLRSKVNYLMGREKAAWRTGIPTYERVTYSNVYPGIDVVYYGNHQQLEYDLVVHPGARTDTIALTFEGADRLSMDPAGNVAVAVDGRTLVQRRPVLYQESDGRHVPVDGKYAIARDGKHVSIEVGDYDSTRELVIDPILVYSTYLGGSLVTGSFDVGVDVAADSTGIYLTGHTISVDLLPEGSTGYDRSMAGSDAYVIKLSPDGSNVIFATYLGGSSGESAHSIAVDADGAVYLTGATNSADFPVTPGAFDTTLPASGPLPCYVAKLNPDGGSLAFATYVEAAQCNGIAVDGSGSPHVSGSTLAASFPVTAGAFDTTHNGNYDALVFKLTPDGTALVYSTFLGGSDNDFGRAVAVDSGGSAYVTGETISSNFPVTPGAFDTTSTHYDAFVVKLDPDGASLAYGTFLGGSFWDGGHGIAVDASGAAYVTGEASSFDFPTTPGAFDRTRGGILLGSDVFVAKLSADGAALIYATYIGGYGTDIADDIAVDAAGAAYVTGYELSDPGTEAFPVTPGAFDTSRNGEDDVFVAKVAPDGGSLAYATFVGGTGDERATGVAVDALGNAYVTGWTLSSDFPVTPGAFSAFHGLYDGFIVKLSASGESMPFG